jgi:hypothetical protein
VVCPAQVMVKVPPVGPPVTVRVWTSLVTAAYGAYSPEEAIFPRGMPDFSFRSGWYLDASTQWRFSSNWVRSRVTVSLASIPRVLMSHGRPTASVSVLVYGWMSTP